MRGTVQTLPGVIYNNTAPSGFFAHTSAVELHWTDEGRLPSTGGHANSKTDSLYGSGIPGCVLRFWRSPAR